MFRSIKAKNFFSWSDLEFDFQSGITLLQGINKDDNTLEGVGKSSICEALVWCLFGQCTKDVNIDDVIQTGHKSCSVFVTLIDGTVIERSRKPNDLAIWGLAAAEAKRGKDAKETQKYINELIGMTFNTFCQSIYFAQNYQNKFITASQEDKAKILSELQDLSIFDKAAKLAADNLKEMKYVNLIHLTAELSHDTETLGFIKSQLDTFAELSKNFDTDKLIQLQTIKEQSRILKNEMNFLEIESSTITGLDSLSAKVESAKETEKYLQECRQKLYLIEALKQQKQEALAQRVCPTCGQSINTNCPDLVIPDNTELKEQETFLQSELVILQSEVNDLLNKQHQNDLLSQKLLYLQAYLSTIGCDIERLENSTNPYQSKIDDLTEQQKDRVKEINKTKTLITEVTKLTQDLDFLKTGFKEIKSHVFQSLLVELNTKTNKYLAELFEISASIKFDNISEEGEISKITTTVLLDGAERSLGLLSGGQFRRVQLAVDFALSEIVAQRANKPINMRILDESFKDLSEPTMQRLVDILQKMPGSTILIEHNSLVKAIVDRTFNIEYRNGISTHEN